MAIVDAVRFFCVRHEINSACDRDHSPCSPREFLHECHRLIKVIFGYTVCDIRIHALCGPCSHCKRLDLRDISAYHGEFYRF